MSKGISLQARMQEAIADERWARGFLQQLHKPHGKQQASMLMQHRLALACVVYHRCAWSGCL